MIIIHNNILPISRFTAMNILGVLFVRKFKGKAHTLSPTFLRHEAIHTAQQYEIITASALVALVMCNLFASWWYLLGVVLLPFVLYIVAWLVALALPPYDRAYKDSPFEREAYANESNPEYFVTRPPFAWVKYIFKTH